MKQITTFAEPVTMYIKDLTSRNTNNTSDITRHYSFCSKTNKVIHYTARGFRSLDAKIDEFSNTPVVNTSSVLNSPTDTIVANRIDTDRLVTTDTFYLNLSDRNVCIKDSSIIPKVFNPVVNNQLFDDSMLGKLIIGVTYYFNNIRKVNSGKYTYDDIYSKLYSKYKDSGDINNRQAAVVLKFLLDNYDTLNSGSDGYETVCVVTHTVVDIKSLTEECEYTAYLPVQNIVVSLLDPELIKPLPNSLDEVRLETSLAKDNLKENTVSYFIVDNDVKLRTKWIVMFGRAVKVTRIKHHSLLCGFYVKGYMNGKPIDEFTPIEEMDTINYLFNSEEEAQEFLNPNKRVEIMKTQVEVDKLKAKAVADEIESNNKKKEKELAKLKFENDLRLTQRSMIKDSRRDYLEERSFQRESFSESIKAVAALAAVGLTLLGVVKIMNSSKN